MWVSPCMFHIQKIIISSRCIARVYLLGDSSALFGTINCCNDTLRVKDDSPAQTQAKLSALSCLAALYENAGRLVGRTYEESFQLMQKWMKSAESQSRALIMNTLTSMVKGLGNGGSTVHKDIYKLAKTAITDRAIYVKVSAAECLTALVPLYTPLFTTELEAACTLCVKAFDGATYELRFSVARFMATLVATSLQPPPGATISGKSNQPVPVKAASLEESLQLLAAGFLRGGIGGFLKGSSGGAVVAGGQKDVRIGVAMAHVEMIRELGSTWLEKNLGAVCQHLIDLAARCGHLAYSTNPAQISEASTLRRCVSYMVRSTIGTMLGENAQLAACKHLGALLAHHINSFDYSVEPGAERSLGSDAYASGYAATVAVLELSALVRQIGTAVTPLFVEASGIMEPVFACLLHPVTATRLATAWCLRCVTIAVPSQLTPLIERCISRLDHMKSSSDAISGYSLALASLVSGSADCKLGIPYAKPVQVLNCAENMLKTATQQSRLAIAKLEAGWNLIYALVSLNSPLMKEHMDKIITLWRAAFPRSAKEAEAEKSRGDSFSWQCAMVSQAGALSVMCGVASQPELATRDNAVASMLLPIECSLVMMSHVGSLIRTYGGRMRQLNSLVRIRLYKLLMLLPPRTYESCYVSLLRELVADITMSDNGQSSLMTSLPNQLCSGAEQILLSPWFGTTDQAMVEDMMQTISCDLGAMGDDVTCVISSSAERVEDLWPEKDSTQLECLDAAIQAYGKVFPLVATKHKVQITEHFGEVVKNCKNAARQQAIHLNVLTAAMLAYKSLCEQRSPRVDNEQLQKASVALIVPALSSSMGVTRFMAAEALARLAQAVAVPQFVASMAQYCFDKLKTCRDAPNRAGHSLALGCLHRHVGSLGSGQHLNTGVSVVLALAQDTSFPGVQSWSLVAMALIAETGGGMFRGFVELVLSVCLKLLLSTPSANVEVVQGIGKLLTALITCVGPELACAGVIDGVRTSLLAACAIQLAHPDPSIRAEAISGLQQMHLFAPRYVHLSQLVVDICSLLSSQHLAIRKAAVSCLRQLVQREAREVREHAQVLVPQGVVDESRKLPLPDTGLEGALFGMLDVEIHSEIRSQIQETLISLVQGTSSELLNNWLSLCKDILATSNDNVRSTLIVEEKPRDKAGDDAEDDEDEGGDDDVNLAGTHSAIVGKGRLQPRWSTKVFATEIVQRLMSVCDTERAHLDLALAKELQMTSGGRCDYLVLHLSDLVRMSFMGATSDNSQLRLAGLRSLQDVINRFSTVLEPEFPGHVILEQFQAQVGAALRPAFTDDTPSHVTAAACQVCSTWIGSGVARDLNDLRRVHHLLVSSLSKLKHGSINTQLYSESAATLEKLSILKAWAEVYVTAVRQEESRRDDRTDELNDNYDDGSCRESLLSLVEPELEALIAYWLASLRDAAMLSLPLHFSNQLPTSGGAFFTLQSAEMCREYYRTSWPPILLATATWLGTRNFELPTEISNGVWVDEGKESRFYLLLGIAVEALSNRTSNLEDVTVQMAVRTITSLVSCEWCQLHLMSEMGIAIEVLNVLHRLILTRDNLTTQALCVECASAIIDAARAAIRATSSRDLENGNVEMNAEKLPASLFSGNETGIGPPNEPTITYTALELCLCTIVRQMPQINATQMKSRSLAPLHLRRLGRLPAESSHLIIRSMQIIVQIPSLCSSSSRIEVLPVVMYLMVGFVRETARIDEHAVVPLIPPGHLTAVAASALQAIRTLASAAPADATLDDWKMIMRSAFYSLLVLTDEDSRIDQCVVMLATVVFATSAPCDVITLHADSFRRFVALLRRQLHSEHVAVRIKALQSIASIFSRRAFGATFVRQLARDVMQVIRPYVAANNGKIQQFSEDDVLITQEAVKALEVLIMIADDKKRTALVSILVQCLVRLLRATSSDEWRQLNSVDRKLHEASIGRLNAAASLWPKEFKKVVEWNADLKSRLEKALLLQTSRHAMAQSARSKAAEIETTTTVQKPKIKLMDFNSFNTAAS
ncbi:unnamed protein product [Caenorhabditis auriculariae]|uniref:HEAT repeat-containing protein 5B n=1 Tax=Caenorhabditis auriculariae TaxID=2777116 RepID=A0A8S1H824_9PELO|nr:unnamed protein product [Caenorhabditis auriculariae]